MMLESLVETGTGSYVKSKMYASDAVTEPYVLRTQVLPAAPAKDNKLAESETEFSST